MQTTSDPFYITLFAKIEYTAVALVPALLYYFILKTLYEPLNLRFKISLSLSILFEIIIWSSDYIVDGFYLYK
jgi:hypothetical protein